MVEQEKKIYVKRNIPQLAAINFKDCHIDFNDADEKYQCKKLIFSDKPFICMTTKGYILRKLFNLLKELFAKIQLLITPQGLFITELNSEGAFFILIQLHSDKFLNYYVPNSFYITLDTKSFASKFEGLKKVQNLLTLSISSMDKINIDILDEKAGKIIHRSDKFTSEDKEMPLLGFNAIFPFKVIVPITFLISKTTKLCGSNKTLKINVTDKYFGFNDMKDVTEPFAHLPELGENKIKNQHVTIDSYYWKEIINKANLLNLHKNGKVTLMISESNPFIYLHQSLGNLGSINYIIATT